MSTESNMNLENNEVNLDDYVFQIPANFGMKIGGDNPDFINCDELCKAVSIAVNSQSTRVYARELVSAKSWPLWYAQMVQVKLYALKYGLRSPNVMRFMKATMKEKE